VRLFKKPKADLTMAEISTRMRGFLLDSQINNAHEISLILGCAAESDELMEKEEEESEKRLERISHLIPLLYAHAQSLSQGAVEYQRSNLPTSMGKLPDAVWWDSRKLLEQVSVAALLGAISQLVDMGLLEIPKRYK
jgi:hypothetical protein